MAITCVQKYVDDSGDEHLTRKGAELANRAIVMAKAIAAGTSLDLRQARQVADYMLANYTIGKIPVRNGVEPVPVVSGNTRKEYTPRDSALAEFSGR